MNYQLKEYPKVQNIENTDISNNQDAYALVQMIIGTYYSKS